MKRMKNGDVPLYREGYGGVGIKRVNIHCHVSIVSAPVIDSSWNRLKWKCKDKDKSNKPFMS